MPEPIPVWTVEDFLAWERQQEERYELIDGIIVAMVGGTIDHRIIIDNLVAVLRDGIKSRRCRAYSDGVKVAIGSQVYYPDVVVSCARQEPKSDFLKDPVLIAEVLSKTTADFDRGRKWMYYQSLDCLLYYLLISQDRQRIDVYARDGNAWRYSVIGDGDGELTLPALDCVVELDQVYRQTGLDPVTEEVP